MAAKARRLTPPAAGAVAIGSDLHANERVMLAWRRFNDCSMGRLITDAILGWCTDCQVAIYVRLICLLARHRAQLPAERRGDSRVDPAGQSQGWQQCGLVTRFGNRLRCAVWCVVVTRADLLNAFPFQNTLATFSVQGFCCLERCMRSHSNRRAQDRCWLRYCSTRRRVADRAASCNSLAFGARSAVPALFAQLSLR